MNQVLLIILHLSVLVNSQESAKNFIRHDDTLNDWRGDIDIPRIDLRGKIFFSHVHKASGISFIRFLQTLPNVVWCSSLGTDERFGMAPNDMETFLDWWFDPNPNCNLFAAESLYLDKAFAKRLFYKKRQLSNSNTSIQTPQLLTFYREPMARCRSNWVYDQGLCHQHDRLNDPFAFQLNKYCSRRFLPYFGRVNDTESHLRFVQLRCSDRSASLHSRVDHAGGFSFIGITEYFESSICLLLFQLGLFPSNLCLSCNGADILKERLNALSYTHTEQKKAFTEAGIPNLNVDSEYFNDRNGRDLGLYNSSLALLDIRIKRVQTALDTPFFSNCESMQ